MRAEGGTPSRWVCEQLFEHVWQSEGKDAGDPARLAALAERLAPQRQADEAQAKLRLRKATDAALARGVFGVPSFECGGHLLWGQDSLDMLAAAVDGDPWIGGPEWLAAEALPVGVERKNA